MPSLERNYQPGSGNERDYRPTIPQLVDLHNESKQLRVKLEKLQLDHDVLKSCISVSDTQFGTVSEKDMRIIALSTDSTTSAVASRWKRLKGSIEKRRRELCEHARRLEETTVEANETTFGHIPSRSAPKSSSRRSATTSNAVVAGVRQPHANRQAEVNEADDSSSNSGSAVEEDQNILNPIKWRQIPKDDVVVDMDGKRLTLRQLAQWFENSDMEAEQRRIFEMKTIEINEKRRLRASN